MIKYNDLPVTQDFLTALLDNLYTAVFVLDKHKQIRAHNNAYKHLFHTAGDITLNKDCDGTSQCGACRLRDTLLEPLLHQIPAVKERLTRKFFVSGQEIIKYLNFSTLPIQLAGEDMVLVLLDDVSGEIESRLEIKRMALTDGLTGLFNHKYLFNKLEEELSRTRRYGGKLSIVMLDIDNFKSINETFGHQCGDRTLVTVSNLLKANLRDIDLVGRYDSVEFLIILPHTDLDSAFLLARRICKASEEHTFEEENLRVTISGGVAELHEGDPGALQMVGRAESLLHSAKQNGRNRIER